MVQPIARILVVDANEPWVRWLFAAMPARVEVTFLRVQPITSSLRRPGPRPRPRKGSPGVRELWTTTLGWSKLGAASTAIIARRVRAALGEEGSTAIVYTLPFYAGVAERLRGRAKQAYFAFDPFRFYEGWDAGRVEAGEERLFKACDGVFAISQRLRGDFQARTPTAVYYSPNAVSAALTKAIADAALPPDLRGVDGPVVGCVGQINSTYDWDLIRATAALLPEVTFVFVGPLLEEPPPVTQQIRAVLGGANLRWVGAKDHGELPGYLRRFDVCWNPMKINEHNHRRSPLRLYDYLATEHPVLSTAVAEVEAHGDLIATAADAQESAALLRKMIHRGYAIDLQARRQYLAKNTWEARADQFLSYLESCAKSQSRTL